MTFTVGQQIFGGFFAVTSVDTETGQIAIASQVLGGPGGPFTTVITPQTTVAELQFIVDEATAAL